MRTTLKLTEIVDEWLMNSDVLKTTKDDYRKKINIWFRWLSARKIDPRSPSRKDVLNYKTQLQSEKSVFTMCSYVTVVKVFYQYCEHVRYCENIAAGIKSSFKQRGHYKKPLTKKQAQRLVNLSEDSEINCRDKLIMSLMLTNGLRVCEIERMNINDFDKRDDGVTIVRIQRKGRTDKKEFISIPDIIEELFVLYTSFRNFKTKDPLFVSYSNNSRGERLSKMAISRMIKKRLVMIGVKDTKITAHSLRHTCGCVMVEEGVDVETIKDMLGHYSTKTTRIYVEQARQQRLLNKNPSSKIASIILKKKRI